MCNFKNFSVHDLIAFLKRIRHTRILGFDENSHRLLGFPNNTHQFNLVDIDTFFNQALDFNKRISTTERTVSHTVFVKDIKSTSNRFHPLRKHFTAFLVHLFEAFHLHSRKFIGKAYGTAVHITNPVANLHLAIEACQIHIHEAVTKDNTLHDLRLFARSSKEFRFVSNDNQFAQYRAQMESLGASHNLLAILFVRLHKFREFRNSIRRLHPVTNIDTVRTSAPEYKSIATNRIFCSLQNQGTFLHQDCRPCPSRKLDVEAIHIPVNRLYERACAHLEHRRTFRSLNRNLYNKGAVRHRNLVDAQSGISNQAELFHARTDNHRHFLKAFEQSRNTNRCRGQSDIVASSLFSDFAFEQGLLFGSLTFSSQALFFFASGLTVKGGLLFGGLAV